MTAEEARNNRDSEEDEKIGHRNTFNLLINDYVNKIENKIRLVSRYTDSLIYPLSDLCNRDDIVKEIISVLEEDGFKVTTEDYCINESSMSWYDLYVTWRK